VNEQLGTQTQTNREKTGRIRGNDGNPGRQEVTRRVEESPGRHQTGALQRVSKRERISIRVRIQGLTFSTKVSNSFERDFRKLGHADRDRIWKLLEQIQEEPHSYKPLSGQLSGMRSARVGDLRVLYIVEENEKRIVLLRVGHRERVYEG